MVNNFKRRKGFSNTLLETFATQEKFKHYLAGFVDGEGCFSVSFRKLDRLKVGIETKVSFSIAQKINPQNYALLRAIRDFFQGGGIRTDKTGCYKYETRSLGHIQKKIVPFFKEYTLHTSKSNDFVCFCEICSLVSEKEHLNKAGCIRILKCSERMNLSGKRRYSLQSWFSLLDKKAL